MAGCEEAKSHSLANSHGGMIGMSHYTVLDKGYWTYWTTKLGHFPPGQWGMTVTGQQLRALEDRRCCWILRTPHGFWMEKMS